MLPGKVGKLFTACQVWVHAEPIHEQVTVAVTLQRCWLGADAHPLNRQCPADKFQQGFQVIGKFQQIKANPVPFQHLKLNAVAPAGFTTTISRAKLIDAGASFRQQLLHCIFG